MLPIPNSDLAETEYFQFQAPEHTQFCRIGRCVHIPDFPERHDAQQIFDLRLKSPEDINEVKQVLAQTPAKYRKVCGHDDETLKQLLQADFQGSWSLESMMVKRHPSEIRPNPEFRLLEVEPGSAQEKELEQREPRLRRSAYHQYTDRWVQGRLLYALHGEEVVGSTGWYSVNGIRRFRYVQTLPKWRRRGVASSLIQHAVETASHCRAVCIFCDERSTIRLYEKLGFAINGVLWSCFIS